MLASSYFVLNPRNPYKKYALFGRNKFYGLDRTDKKAQELVELYRSQNAHKYVSKMGALLAFFVIAVNAVIFLISRSIAFGRNIGLDYYETVFVGCLLGSFIFIGSRYVLWGYSAWASLKK